MTISRGLNRAMAAVRDVSEGDLTKTAAITTRDEIGELLGCGKKRLVPGGLQA